MIITDHHRIKTWIQVHGGRPEVINEEEAGVGKAGIRINFPGNLDERYLSESDTRRGIGWNEFFDIFEKQNLAFEFYGEEKKTTPSTSYRFVKRESIS